MNIQHEIDKKNGTVEVTVTLLPRNGNKISIKEEYVRNYLIEQKVRASKCAQTAFVSNSIPPYSGTWIFELDNGKSTVVKSMNERKDFRNITSIKVLTTTCKIKNNN